MSVSVYECDPRSVADLLLQLPVLVQVFASMVVVVPVVLSRSVAVAQSNVTVSVQTTRYQKVRVPPAEAAASIGVVVPVVLAFSVADAQSYVTVSLHTTRYQKDRVPPAAGAVNVCATELSPLNGDPLPTWAAATPP